MFNLIAHLPRYYSKSAVMAAILLPHEEELQRIADTVEVAERQMLISEATTALSRYEQDIGITANESEDYDTRRNRILAHLRGKGTVTLDMLRTVVGTYIDGIVQIEESPSEYTIYIKFVTTKGIPANLEQVKAEIADIVPAHLYVEYIFTYRTWNDVANLVGTWNDVAAYTWDGLAAMEVLTNLRIADGQVFYCPNNDGNAMLVYEDGKPYARLYEEIGGGE